MDLTKIDVDAAFERFAKVAGVDAKLLAGPHRAAREAVAALRKAGAKDVYAVLSIADLPNPGPFLLIPTTNVNTEELKAALRNLTGQTVEPLDGVMLVGDKRTLERLHGLKPAARPDLDAAFGAVAGSPVQIAFVPSEDQRRVVKELLPTLPKEVGGGPGTILTKGLRWAAVGVETKPKLAVKLVVQSENAEAAKALADAAERGLDSVIREQTVRRVFPKADELVKVVRPKVDGDRLTIAVDESAPGVAGGFASLIGQARSTRRPDAVDEQPQANGPGLAHFRRRE